MVTGHLKIHSENILPIIKKWLYSDKDIFARELVSNCCDAIHKVQVLRDHGEIESREDVQDGAFNIHIFIDKEKRTLTFTDNGIGMDSDEVEKYITQLAFSGAEEFVQKYQTNNERDQIIGHFGLGFYSSYMVSEKVEINTLSYKPGAEAVHWVCDGGSSYQMDKGSKQTRGTEVVLHIDKENEEYLDPAHLRHILNHYCSFLPYPIYLNDSQINSKAPLWIKSASECTDKDYIDFYQQLFPFEPEPIFWIHLNVDYPFHLKGVLYFPKVSQESDFRKDSIKLYCNRVFVSDHCKDLLPEYLTVLRGAIDSPDIPLNVSRSYLQMDKTVRQLGSHISKKVSDRLATLYKTDREKFIRCWEDVELIVKYGAIQDDKFYERVKEFLIWKNNHNEWTTLDEYLERHADDYQNKIFYSVDEKHSSHFLDLYREKNIEVLFTKSMMDNALIHTLERKIQPATFQRIDAGISETLLDPSKEKTLLDAEGRTEASKMADFVRGKLGQENLEVEAKSLASDSLPGFLMIKEEERRLRDHLAYTQKEKGKFAHALVKPTFIVNTNSKLLTAIRTLDIKDPELSKELLQEVYDLALLSQREMDPEGLSRFVARSTHILEKLACRLTENS